MLVLYIHTGARKPMGRGILGPVTGGEDPSMLPPRRKEDREEERRRRAGLKWRMEWGRGRHGVLVISYILSYFGRGTKVEDFVLYERKSWKGDIAVGPLSSIYPTESFFHPLLSLPLCVANPLEPRLLD